MSLEKYSIIDDHESFVVDYASLTGLSLITVIDTLKFQTLKTDTYVSLQGDCSSDSFSRKHKDCLHR